MDTRLGYISLTLKVDEAEIFSAARRADALLEDDNLAGRAVWIAILERIRQLTQVRDGEIRQ